MSASVACNAIGRSAAGTIPHVLVIGGGFSGTMTAVQLARLSRAPLRVTVVNKGYPTGRGVAYSASRKEHLLNVPARNMSAFPNQPSHFMDWIRANDKDAATDDTLPGKFMPRQVYGKYLQSLLHHYMQPAAADGEGAHQVSIETVDGEAVDIESEAKGGARVLLADGSHILADKVVLATGNESPPDLPGTKDVTVSSHRGWCGNPWSMDWSRLPPSGTGATIVLLGTGLTAVDCIITLLQLKWQGTVLAVSRHALLPLSHPATPPVETAETANFPPPDVASMGLEKLAELMQKHCAQLRSRGIEPILLVDKMRPHTQRVWQSWTVAEKEQFVQRYAARWNILRHRIAPSLHNELTAAIASSRLQVSSGSIVRLHAKNDDVLTVDLRDHTSGKPLPSIDASLVINCTGPHTRFLRTTSTLLQKALSRHLLRPDSMDMGVAVNQDFSVWMDDAATESHSPILYAIGPLLRGTLWESIAVPELRGQAQHVATTILADLKIDAHDNRSQ